MKIKGIKILIVIVACLAIIFSICALLNTKKETTLTKYGAETVKRLVDPGEAIIETWDISSGGSFKSVSATLYADGKLVISGTGKMKSWNKTDNEDWHNEETAKEIKKVIVESGVTTIGRYAFANCTNLIEVEISDTVERVGAPQMEIINSDQDYEEQIDNNNLVSTVFEGCKNLLNILVDVNNSNYASKDGVLFDEEITELQYYPEGKKEEAYSIPETVIKIRSYAFKNAANLVTINIPEGVKTIKEYAFENSTGIINIEIPASVTSIGCRKIIYSGMAFDAVSAGEALVFSGCSNLETINVAENNLKYSSKNGILLNKNQTEMLCYPIGRKETSYTVFDGIRSINAYAFLNCKNLIEIKMSEDLTTIEGNAFENCTGLTSIYIPKNVSNILIRTR